MFTTDNEIIRSSWMQMYRLREYKLLMATSTILQLTKKYHLKALLYVYKQLV